MPQSINILFLLGPSGSGKTTLGNWLEEDTDFGWQHIEIDRWPEGDGIDLEGLRPEWDAFCTSANAKPLAITINARLASARFRGATLSFPSGVVLSNQHLIAAEQAGIGTLILYGTGADCMEAFLKRGRESRRGLNEDHWKLNNAHSYAEISQPIYAKYRILAFDQGQRRERVALLKEIKGRLLQLGV